jgi:predicted secreted protein
MSATKSLGVILRKIKSGDEAEDLVIQDLTSIGEFGVESEEIDVTTLDSTGGFKEFIAGSKDAGEISLAGFTKSENNIGALYALASSQEVESWEVEFPDGAIWELDGFVKSFKEGESSVDGVRNFSASIRISGEPEYTGAGVSA